MSRIIRRQVDLGGFDVLLQPVEFLGAGNQHNPRLLRPS
jgi:hypothetical protein